MTSRLKTAVIITLLLALPLGKITWDSYNQFIITQEAKHIVQSLLLKYKDTQIKDFQLFLQEGEILVYLELISQEEITPDPNEIAQALNEVFDRPVEVSVQVIQPIVSRVQS